MQRIEQFLKEDEVPDWASTLSGTNSNNEGSGTKLGFANATFQWQEPPKTDSSSTLEGFTLGPLDMILPEGQITLISGPTGSGKSAVLAALLGGALLRLCLFITFPAYQSGSSEMSCVSGSVYINKANHQVAYCAQNPCQCHLSSREFAFD